MHGRDSLIGGSRSGVYMAEKNDVGRRGKRGWDLMPGMTGCDEK